MSQRICVQEGVRQRSDIDVTEQDDSYCSPTSEALSSATWLDNKLELVSIPSVCNLYILTLEGSHGPMLCSVSL